jgi:serine phosphatase RsbU (regulator of sigma subunit)
MATQENGFAEQVSRQAEELRRALDTGPRNGTIRDLCRRFTPFLGRVFPHATFTLSYRDPGSVQWLRAEDGLPAPHDGQGNGTGDSDPSTFLLDGTGSSLRVLHTLGDGSFLFLQGSQVQPAPPFTELDLLSLRLYVHLFDTASQKLLARQTEKGLIFSLNQRVLQLTSLIDTGIEVSRLDAGVAPHQLALERAASLTNASGGVLTIDRGNGTREQVAFPAAFQRPPEPRPGNHILSSFSFHGHTYTYQLFDKESRRVVQEFDETDQMLLDALVRQVQASLENRYLHAQSLEKQRIEQDMAVAASIQQRILPAALPAVEGYDFAGINIPSKSVGGDYYDCIPLPDGRYALVIADVSGKGVPAALLVSSLHAYLSAYLESPISLTDLARRLNRVIWNAATEDKFITAYMALLTPATGELTSLNAGHTPVFLRRKDGSVQELNSGGVPFGMLEMEFPYQAESVVVEPGDRLLLYTDGVTEAMNEAGELYDTVKPFKSFFTDHLPDRANRFIDDLVAEMKSFMGAAPQNDDITAMYVMRRG